MTATDLQTWRSRSFSVAIWSLIGALYFFSPFVLVVLGWFQEPFSELGGAETVSHRVHEVLFGVVFAQAMVGAVSQLRHARDRLAGMLQTIAALGGLVAILAALGEVETLGTLFVVLALLAALLHPAGWKMGWGSWRPSPGLLALTVTGAVPLVLMALDNLAKARVQAADHLTHWGGVAAFALVQVLLALIAAMRPPGFRIPGASVGAGGIIYVVASFLFPFDASARPGLFAFWLAAWSAVWLGVAFSDRPVRSVIAAAGSVLLSAVFIAFGVSGMVVGGFFAVVLFILSRRPGGWPRPVSIGLFACGGLLVGAGALAAAQPFDPPNVPHGLDLAYAQATRQTCLDCHVQGQEGATLIPHAVDQTCGPDEHCWGGRTDCLGCHRYDPALGGSNLEVRSPASVLAAAPRDGTHLTPAQLVVLGGLSADPDG